jgi:hypothetical protein
MTFKEIIQSLGSKSKERKALLKQMKEQDYLEQRVQEMKKSSNQRELESYEKEDYEKMIKEKLEFARKKRQQDITYNHNPLNVKNITNHTDWQVLKEKNQFTNKGNMFSNQEFIHKSNKKLLNSGNVLKGKYLFKKGGYSL